MAENTANSDKIKCERGEFIAFKIKEFRLGSLSYSSGQSMLPAIKRNKLNFGVSQTCLTLVFSAPVGIGDGAVFVGFKK